MRCLALELKPEIRQPVEIATIAFLAGVAIVTSLMNLTVLKYPKREVCMELFGMY